MRKNKENNFTKAAALLLCIALIFPVTGCHAKGKSSGEMIQNNPQPSTVAVADNSRMDEEIPAGAQLSGKNIYFVWNESGEDAGGAAMTTLYTVDGDKKKPLTSVGAEGYITYFIDGEETAYLVYRADPGKPAVSLRAVSAVDGSLVYDENLTDMFGDDARTADGLNDIAVGVHEDGGPVYMACADGRLYVYDENNKAIDYKKLAWDESLFYQGMCGLVDTGTTGAFEYSVDGSRITLRCISDGQETYEFELGSVDGEVQSPQQMILRETELCGGCDGGVFVRDAKGLWKYVFSGKEPERLFDWDDEYVNLGGRQIRSVGYVGGEGFFVLSRAMSGGDALFSAIEYRDMLSVEEKQTVTIGIYKRSGDSYNGIPINDGSDYYNALKSWFNNKSEKYTIEYVEYSDYSDMQMALVMGDAPDLMLGLEAYIPELADKGALEDLSPYFERSAAVSEEDLLTNVKNAVTHDGKLVAVTDSFYISGLWVKKDSVKPDWGIDEFLGLIEENPHAAVRNWQEWEKEYLTLPYFVMWYYLLEACDTFVDPDSGVCSFDSGEFAEMLERLARLELAVPDQEYSKMGEEAFLNGKLLFAADGNVFHWGGFQSQMEEYGEYAEFLGYPHDDGVYYKMKLNHVFVMNSAAKNKEGAWAVLETVLFQNYQGSFAGEYFPVTKEYFERHIQKITGYGKDEEARAYLRYAIENSYTRTELQDICIEIIGEEIKSFFDGQKSAREVAGIIQSRMQAYIDEQ